jgi:Ni/Fe-hydrogenase subunit HybB-like protein
MGRGSEVINGTLQRRMDALRKLQRFLDEAFRVPGTKIRFGWDPIIGAVPWLGDALTAVFSCAILVQAHHMRVPRVVQLRMLANVAVDLVAGTIPFIGDVADVFWKSNAKNFALLERHAAAPAPATAGDWLFAIGIVAIVAAIALVPLFVLYWVVNVLPAHLPPLAR